MFLTPFTSLTWAYQLHYYLAFRTHRRHKVFWSKSPELNDLIAEICDRHQIHLLECQPHPDQVRTLVSLRPDQRIAKTIQILKTNSSREWNRRFDLRPPLWPSGYLARSVGLVRTSAVRTYLDQQAEHHGYACRIRPPVYRYKAEEATTLAASHAFVDLTHHLVLSTNKRKSVFDSVVGKALADYWLRVATKHGFAIDRLSLVPDHVHLIVRILPRMSIEECALFLMNNGQHFIGKNYPQILIQAGIDQLWQPSAYAGTCGDYTTGLIQQWLSSAEK
jgi:putative transposase